jgi:hypothetical protein
MRGQIRFKPGLSNEYKDLVNKILVYETTERLPLIKVFDHPWVKNFEKKYNLSKQPTPKKDKPKKDKKDKAVKEPPKEEKVPEKKADAIRNSRKSNSDIIKELEDYVNEKKVTGKYLDDLSEMDNTPLKKQERMSKKMQKEKSQEANIDVYDYCDKMMKDLSHLDKQLENRMSNKEQPSLSSIRYSST